MTFDFILWNWRSYSNSKNAVSLTGMHANTAVNGWWKLDCVAIINSLMQWNNFRCYVKISVCNYSGYFEGFAIHTFWWKTKSGRPSCRRIGWAEVLWSRSWNIWSEDPWLNLGMQTAFPAPVSPLVLCDFSLSDLWDVVHPNALLRSSWVKKTMTSLCTCNPFSALPHKTTPVEKQKFMPS